MADILVYQNIPSGGPDFGASVAVDNDKNPILTATYGQFYVNGMGADGPSPGFAWLAIGF
jgi:hypothetical protein